MTSLFDGLAGALNDIFGAPMLFLPRHGGERTIQSIFREEPVTVPDSEGRDVLVVAPIWKVPETEADEIGRGDRIDPGNGKIYRILNRIHTGSPALDRFAVFQLQEEC